LLQGVNSSGAPDRPRGIRPGEALHARSHALTLVSGQGSIGARTGAYGASETRRGGVKATDQGPTARSSERPASSRGHWAMGRPPGHTGTGGQSGEPPSVRVMEHCCGQPGGRVLPRLLASVHGEVHERVAVVHGLRPAAFRPVGFRRRGRRPVRSTRGGTGRSGARRGVRRGKRVLSTTACPSP
jgi:hypothetical protein